MGLIDGDALEGKMRRFVFADVHSRRSTEVVMRMRGVLSLVVSVLMCLALPFSSHAALWTGDGGDLNWHNAANWDPGVPTSSSIITLGGAAVEVHAPATYSSPSSTSSGTINVMNDGVLTPSGANHLGLRYLTLINVNNGGTLTAPSGMAVRSSITIAAGGLVTGTSDIRDGRTLTVGGTFRPGSKVYIITTGGGNSHVTLTSTGTIQLNVFGDGDNQSFSLLNGSLNLVQGSIVLAPQGGYVPQVGDSYVLWTRTAGTANVGDGSNISMPGFQLDTTKFQAEGIVSVVPEPAAMGLLSGALVLLARRRRLR
jgi:hypothetical protein